MTLPDERLAVDSNAAERAVKNIAFRRKNFLFFGSDHAGERAAVINTMIETAKLNRVNLQAWLVYVIATVGECKQTNLVHLLPWNWAEEG
ncbi:MAG: transposase domain-containing protein [Pseudomonadota bacterium]